MKKALWIAVCIMTMPLQALAGSGEVEGTWQLARDFDLDGRISSNAKRHQVECNSHHNKFVCRYIGADRTNDSIFAGETYQARTTKIISFFQYDATYYVTHSGREQGRHRFVGTWYDVAGNAGDFELRK